MKFRVLNEAGTYQFALDIADGHMQTLEAYAASQNVPVHVALQNILESEVGRVYRDLNGARELFDSLGLRELAYARAAFVGDRDDAVRDGDDEKARFARGRIALIDMVLKRRAEKP